MRSTVSATWGMRGSSSQSRAASYAASTPDSPMIWAAISRSGACGSLSNSTSATGDASAGSAASRAVTTAGSGSSSDGGNRLGAAARCGASIATGPHALRKNASVGAGASI